MEITNRRFMRKYVQDDMWRGERFISRHMPEFHHFFFWAEGPKICIFYLNRFDVIVIVWKFREKQIRAVAIYTYSADETARTQLHFGK